MKVTTGGRSGSAQMRDKQNLASGWAEALEHQGWGSLQAGSSGVSTAGPRELLDDEVQSERILRERFDRAVEDDVQKYVEQWPQGHVFNVEEVSSTLKLAAPFTVYHLLKADQKLGDRLPMAVASAVLRLTQRGRLSLIGGEPPTWLLQSVGWQLFSAAGRIKDLSGLHSVTGAGKQAARLCGFTHSARPGAMMHMSSDTPIAQGSGSSLPGALACQGAECSLLRSRTTGESRRDIKRASARPSGGSNAASRVQRFQETHTPQAVRQGASGLQQDSEEGWEQARSWWSIEGIRKRISHLVPESQPPSVLCGEKMRRSRPLHSSTASDRWHNFAGQYTDDDREMPAPSRDLEADQHVQEWPLDLNSFPAPMELPLQTQTYFGGLNLSEPLMPSPSHSAALGHLSSSPAGVCRSDMAPAHIHSGSGQGLAGRRFGHFPHPSANLVRQDVGSALSRLAMEVPVQVSGSMAPGLPKSLSDPSAASSFPSHLLGESALPWGSSQRPLGGGLEGLCGQEVAGSSLEELRSPSGRLAADAAAAVRDKEDSVTDGRSTNARNVMEATFHSSGSLRRSASDYRDLSSASKEEARESGSRHEGFIPAADGPTAWAPAGQPGGGFRREGGGDAEGLCSGSRGAPSLLRFRNDFDHGAAADPKLLKRRLQGRLRQARYAQKKRAAELAVRKDSEAGSSRVAGGKSKSRGARSGDKYLTARVALEASVPDTGDWSSDVSEIMTQPSDVDNGLRRWELLEGRSVGSMRKGTEMGEGASPGERAQVLDRLLVFGMDLVRQAGESNKQGRQESSSFQFSSPTASVASTHSSHYLTSGSESKTAPHMADMFFRSASCPANLNLATNAQAQGTDLSSLVAGPTFASKLAPIEAVPVLESRMEEFRDRAHSATGPAFKVPADQNWCAFRPAEDVPIAAPSSGVLLTSAANAEKEEDWAAFLAKKFV